MNQKKKTLINLIVGLVSQIIVLVIGLIVPRIVLVNYGSDINGLTNTISQIFTYMALLEAGISVSARNAFYKPIQENDRDNISFVASLAKKYYRKVSSIYLISIIGLSLVFPLVLKTNVPYLTVCIYILFEGLTAVVFFYYINTWKTFLGANGDSYITNIFALISKVLCYIVKIWLSLHAVNIAFIQIGFFAVSLVQLFIYYLYMRNKYGWIQYDIDTRNEMLKDKNANLISEIAWVVFSSTDMIVLSVCVSTSMSSVYSIYNMVFVALHSLLFAVYNSVNYHLGIEFNSRDRKKYIKLHDAYMVFFVGCISALMSVSYLLIIPFVKLYTSGVTDVNYIYTLLPLFFCLVQILSWSRYVTGNLIGISFRQKPAVKVNIAESLINLSLSLILVWKMGIEGVLLATVIALPLKVVYCTYISDVVILKRSPQKTISILAINYMLFFAFVIANHFVNLSINNYLQFFTNGVVLTLIIIAVFSIVNGLLFKDVVMYVKKIGKNS